MAPVKMEEEGFHDQFLELCKKHKLKSDMHEYLLVTAKIRIVIIRILLIFKDLQERC